MIVFSRQVRRIGLLAIMGLLGTVVTPVPVSLQAQAQAQSQTQTQDDPAKVISRLGRGINLGNALEAPKEGEWGVVLRAEDFAKIAAAGFQSVRLPVRWSAHAMAEAPYTVDPSFAARVDWALAQAKAHQLAVVLNVHHYEEMDKSPKEHKARLLALWGQIASRYQGESSDLVFELFNEPHAQFTPQLWNEVIPELLAVVRATNPTRAVIVGPGQWNGFRSLKDLKLPKSDQHLIVTIHYYEPFEFTHQNAFWVPNSRDWAGKTWSGTPEEQAKVRSALETAAQWGQAEGRPIYLGEFGAYSGADLASRVAWTRFVRQEAERLGMAWSYWEYCSGFGAFDPVAQEWRAGLKNALLHDASPAKP